MRRLLVKKTTTLVILLLLLTISWLHKPSSLPIDESGVATEHLEPPALISQDYVQALTADAQSEEDLEDVTLRLSSAYIDLIAPDVLPLYSTLVSSVFVENAEYGLECLLTWYLDDDVILEEWIVIGSDLPYITYNFEYSRTLAETVVVKVSIQHVAEYGETYELTAQKVIAVDNYSKTHWMELEAPRVLEEVSSIYEGDFTLEWALENDYHYFDKEVFVNMSGYESDTDYLLWVNRSHQRVNVFQKSDGYWELIEVFIVGTGRPGRGTKRGVTHIPSRTTDGWHFGSYRVRPVVRFWPGLNYAFHSRILHPSRDEVTNEGIGFPISNGCVRMYCDDVWYIYHNIPDDTTVVVH